MVLPTMYTYRERYATMKQHRLFDLLVTDFPVAGFPMHSSLSLETYVELSVLYPPPPRQRGVFMDALVPCM